MSRQVNTGGKITPEGAAKEREKGRAPAGRPPLGVRENKLAIFHDFPCFCRKMEK